MICLDEVAGIDIYSHHGLNACDTKMCEPIQKSLLVLISYSQEIIWKYDVKMIYELWLIIYWGRNNKGMIILVCGIHFKFKYSINILQKHHTLEIYFS